MKLPRCRSLRLVDSVVLAAESKSSVLALALTLSELHRAVLEGVREQHEATHAPADGSTHPVRFGPADAGCLWLRNLSEVMMYAYELLGTDRITPTDAATFRVAVERLISGTDGELGNTYADALRSRLSMLVVDARVRNALDAIPLPEYADRCREGERG